MHSVINLKINEIKIYFIKFFKVFYKSNKTFKDTSL